MGYLHPFEPWYRNIDTIFIGIEQADSRVRAYHLCPYSTETIKEALSFKSTKERVLVIDNVILKCMGL